MSGNYRDSSHRNPVPFEYCTCRCNFHFNQYSSFNRSYSANLTNTSHTTTTNSNNTHYNKDLTHSTQRDGTEDKEVNMDLGDVAYVNTGAANIYATNSEYMNSPRTGNALGPLNNHKTSNVSDLYKLNTNGTFDNNNVNTELDKEMINKFKNLNTNNTFQERDTPLLSDGTDLTNGDNISDSEYLERLHCASCDKPLLMYTNLDFKMFDNWINYVFYHKSFSPSVHSATPFEQDASATQDVNSEFNVSNNELTERVATESSRSEKETLTEIEVTEKSNKQETHKFNAQNENLDESYKEKNTESDCNVMSSENENKYDININREENITEESYYVPITYKNEDLRSIGDITGSILMSSEETLFTIINSISPGEQCTNEKNQLFDSVKRFLQYCLGEDTIVHLTGSTAYDIDIDYSEGASTHCNSDLDIVLLSNTFGGDPRMILQKVYNELSNMQHVLKERNKCPIWVLADSSIKLVESAKVPIIIIETKNGLLCDISVNTLYPLLHTELFKSYIDDHPMVRPLMRIIKHWLLIRGLPTMKEGGFPSILWMSLFCNSLDATIVNTSSNLELMSSQFRSQMSVESQSFNNLENAVSHSVDSSLNTLSQTSNTSNSTSNVSTSVVNNEVTLKVTPRDDNNQDVKTNVLSTGLKTENIKQTSNSETEQVNVTQSEVKSTPFNTSTYNYAAAVAGLTQNLNNQCTNVNAQNMNTNSQYKNNYSQESVTYDEYEYKEEEDEDEDYDELNMSETYREMFTSDWTGGYSIGQLWEQIQGGRGEFGILCSLEKCFVNMSKGLSLMDIVNRFLHIKNGSDYGGMSLFCKNIIRLIEMESNVPYGTWLVYYYELNRAKEYMTLYSKRLEILVTLLTFLRLICNNSNSIEDLKSLSSEILQMFGYDLSHLWTGNYASRRYNSLYVNNQYNLNISPRIESPERMLADFQSTNSGRNIGPLSENLTSNTCGDSVEVSGISSATINSASTSADSTFSSGLDYSTNVTEMKYKTANNGDVAKKSEENVNLMSILNSYLTNIASLFKIQLHCSDPETSIKLLIYHMFQQFKSIPNEIFEGVRDNIYSIPVAIEPPTPIEDDPDFGHRFECGLWDDSGWYIVVLQDRLCVVKVIKICIEWEFWWSKDFVSRRDTRSIFHGFVYRQLRLDLKKQMNNASFSTFSVNSPSILVKRGSLVLFNPCDIVSKLHVLKVVKHEQYISPSLYSTDFYTGVKCLYVLPGFEVDRFMCFEQIAHKLKHYVEFRPHVTFCKLCGIVNMKKINTYTENKIPQRKLRNARYVLCNHKYNHIYNLMQYKHPK